MNETIVMKFGGASLATPKQFDTIADLITERGIRRLVVVVSAMGKTTDELISLAKEINPNPPQRELDMLISVGERISMSLLAMALSKKGRDAISFTGSQSGIITSPHHNDAKIIDVRPQRILNSLEQGKIVIVAGFQGVSLHGEITTLGRGGSDTSAVALGIALGAAKVEFYKDVPGLFERDPKTDPNARFYPQASYDLALDIVAKGCKILHHRCLLLAKANSMPLHILSFEKKFHSNPGTYIRNSFVQQITKSCYEEATICSQ
jgi:aspartate kinase